MATTIGLLLFEGCDVMDVTGPYEVFLTAGRLQERDGKASTFDVRTVSVDGRAVTAYGGLGLLPSHGALVPSSPYDVLLVPGLIDLAAGLADEGLLDVVRAGAAVTDVMGSVCTGAFLLEAAGVLGDVPATTHWEDAGLLAERRTAGAVTRDDVRWVDAGSVVTAGGLSSGVAMALHLVERFASRDLAERTAHQIDYVWTEAR